MMPAETSFEAGVVDRPGGGAGLDYGGGDGEMQIWMHI